MADFTNNQIKNTYQRVLQEHGGELQNGLGESLTGSLSLSGSLNVTGSQTIGGTLSVTGNSSISGSLVVVGDVTARSVITQLTQSTVLYQSGSTKFGDTLDDRHDFTGSFGLTGSMTLNLSELTLDGTFRHTGSLIHSGTLSVDSTGDINLTGNITQSGNVDLTGDITQVGTLVRNGNTTITGSLSHSGSTVAEGKYEVKEGVYGAFFANPQTINKNVTIPASYNSRIFGPITVAAGKTLIVGANAKLEIIDI